ncbi:MAG TPA: OmpA family protein [Salinimicrobium sp.]|nr:OmpA family protein [Salinimicrobium sp.]
MNRKYLIYLFLIFPGMILSAQSGMQKKADRLFDDFAFVKAADVYEDLIEQDYNTTYNKKKLGDTYLRLRDPENAVKYYSDVVQQPGISPEYYYKYAQALRGVRKYEESREWLRKYQEEGKNAGLAEEILEADDILTYDGLENFVVRPSEINSDVSDFGAYERNGIIYFTSARAEGSDRDKIYAWNGEPFLDVYQIKDGVVSPIPGDINTKYHEGPVTISADGETMFFTRNNFIENKRGKKDDQDINHLKIYKATMEGGQWTNIEETPFSSNEYSVGHPAISADGKTLYFASEAPGGFGGSDIYSVSIEGNTYGTPENLGELVNTPGNEVFPFVSENNQLYFSSDGHRGYGLLDVFVIDLENMSQAENLGSAVNSNLDDFAFTLTGEGDGYVSSNRKGQGSDDIYMVEVIEPIVVRGVVTDSINNKPIANATVRLMDPENESQIAFLETDSLGRYQTEVKRGIIYPINAKHIEYETKSGQINTNNTADLSELVYDFELAPIRDVEYLAEINKIYFDFDEHTIRPDAAVELDKLADLMINEYPDMVIEIGSHTDRRGSDQYNRKLAERRAQATYDYLISKGVGQDRIVTYQGYGEEKPQVDCTDCSEKQHQLNRRSIFKVVKME